MNLWRYTGPDGQTLAKAVDYLLPAATGAAPWPYPELEFHRYAASDIVHAAADAGDRAAQAAVLQTGDTARRRPVDTAACRRAAGLNRRLTGGHTHTLIRGSSTAA